MNRNTLLTDRQTDDKNFIREKIYCAKHFLTHKYYDIVQERFTKKQRKRLKNDNFTIISSNCIGGFIYHRLGKQFLSPTINLFFNQKEFLKFVQNLEYYLELPLCFIENNCGYPVAKLGDISLSFLHYTSDDEAKVAWERRKTRINYDNLFVIMYDKDGLTEDDFETFGTIKCKNKIILSDRDYKKYPYIKKLTKRNNQKDNKFFYKDKCNIMTFERQWDYVDWLNT